MVPATSPAASRASTNNKKKRSRSEISTSKKVENGGKRQGSKKQRSGESSANAGSLRGGMTTAIANSPSTNQALANSNNQTMFSGSSIPNPPPLPPQQKRPSVQTTYSGQKLLVPPPPFGGSSDDSKVGTDERATTAVPMNSNVWMNNHRKNILSPEREMATDIAARSLNTDNDEDHCRQGLKKAASTNNNCQSSSSQPERLAERMGSNNAKKFSPIFLFICLFVIGLVVVTSLWLHQSLTIQMDLAELRQQIDYYQMRLDAYKQAVDGTGSAIDAELDEADQVKSIKNLKARLQQQEFRMEGIKTQVRQGSE